MNIEPFGKKLGLIELQKRMRHTTIEVLLDHYVHNNPLAEMKKYKELFSEGSKDDLIRKLSLEEILTWLRRLGVPHRQIWNQERSVQEVLFGTQLRP